MQLRTNDKHAGLDTPDGRSFKPNRDGILTLPDRDDAYARAAGRTGLFEPRVQGWGGVDVAELAAQYAAWEAQRQEASE